MSNLIDKVMHIEKNDKLVEEHPCLACDLAKAFYYPDENYLSIKCSKLGSSCTYNKSKGNEYTNCIILRRMAN